MATINIPGRRQGQDYRLVKIEGSPDTWLDLTFRMNVSDSDKYVEVRLTANETWQVVHGKLTEKKGA